MKSDTQDLAYDQLRIAANAIANVMTSEAYDDYQEVLEYFSTALAARLRRIQKGCLPLAYQQLLQLQTLIENARSVYDEAA